MPEVALRLAQAAQELGIKINHLENLCRANLVEYDRTSGGHRRIPWLEIERLKRDGVPPNPVFLEAADPQEPELKAPPKTPAGNNRLAPPSPQMIEAVEEAEIEEAAARREEAAVNRKAHIVRKLSLEYEEQQARDRLQERDRQEQAAIAAKEAKRQQLEEIRQHQLWVQGHVDSALGRLYWEDVPGDVQIELSDAITARLENASRTQSDSLTRRIIDAVTEATLAPWKQRKKIEDVIRSVCYQLPIEFNYQQNADWKSRAVQAVRKSIEGLGDVPEWQMRATGTAATKPFIAALEHAQCCAKIAAALPAGLTTQERDDASEQIQEALAKLPVGTAQRKLEQVASGALEPFRQAIAQRTDNKLRENVISLAWLFRIPTSKQDEARKQIREALAKLPTGTPERDLEAARENVIDRMKKDHEREEAKEKAIEDGVNHVYSYVETLARDWDFDEDTWTLAQELKPIVKEQLEDELTGKESPQQATGITERLIRDYLDVPKRRK